ncbi:toxin VasX [Saccharicrinis aurantiacus]|uniref:toxin VasX n=1 Tax=Saccharicrinis aurantiacus TaxID=1849719 RepID=UPI002492FE51|nr:toxin VasX [Saccharicrinis aurantiacus]
MDEINDLAECVVTANYAEAEAKGDKLIIKPTTISLNFNRYIIAKNTRKNFFSWPIREEATNYEPQGAPSIDGYTYKATQVREGYIYIHFENKPDLFKEFKVSLNGEISNILSDLSEDVRTNVESRSVKYYSIKNTDIVWVAYSEFQWSAKYIQEIRSKQDVREKRMQKFDASEWIENNTATDAYSVDNIDGYFPLEDYDEAPRKLDEERWSSGSIEDNIKSGQIQWWKTYFDNVEVNEEVPDERAEVFFCLHDPIGCANDIGEDLEHHHIYLESIVESLQYGINVEDVYKVKLANKELYEIFNLSDTVHLQVNALYNTALTIYQLVYDDKKMTSDYDGGDIGFWNFETKGNGINKEKVLNVLGFEERKKQRELIKESREAFGKLLLSDYYKNIYRDIDITVSQCVLDGKCNLTEHMSLLAMVPHTNDKHLELPSTYSNYINPWSGFFKDTSEVDDSKPLNRLLDAEIEITQLYSPVVDVANKLGGITRNLVGSYAEQTISELVEKTKTVTRTIEKTKLVTVQETKLVSSSKDMCFRRLMKHKVYGQQVLDLQSREVQKIASEFENEVIDYSRIESGKYRGKKPINRFVISDEVVLKQKLRGKNIVQIPTQKEVVNTYQKTEKYLAEIQESFKYNDVEVRSRYSNADLAQNLFDSKVFTGSLAVLQVFNVINAYASIEKGQYKTVLNAVGISAELAEASMYFMKSRAMINGAAETTINNLSKKALRFGRAGGVATVLVCAWDAINSSSVNDNDSMLAWAGASGAWAVFMFWGGTGLGFTPPGLIVGGVAMGLTALAYYLKDTPLEAFFKNNVLSDAYSFELRSNEKSWEYNIRLYNDRSTLIKKTKANFWGADAYGKWQDLSVAYQDFIDILICPQVKFSVLEKSKANTIHPWTTTNSVTIRTSNILSYRAEICFRQFLTNKDQLKYEIFYYPNGVGLGECIDIVPQEIKCEVIKSKKSDFVPRVILDFKIDPLLLNKNNINSQLLFICRLDIGGGNFYPFSVKDTERYIGAKFTTFEQETEVKRGFASLLNSKSSEFQSSIKIDTKSELVKG